MDSKRVKTTEQTLGGAVDEITPDGKTVHRWESWNHLNLEEDVICPLGGRKEWTHVNAINFAPKGELLVSYRRNSTVGLVDQGSGNLRWKWDPGEASK